MRSGSLLVLLSFVCACAPDRLQDVEQSVILSPAAVSFGRVITGTQRSRAVEVHNAGRSAMVFAARVQGPGAFSTPPAGSTWQVEAGGHRTLELLFAPQEPGLADGVLVVEAAGRRWEVALSAEAVVAEACETQNPCEVAAFDPDLGCVSRPAAEGALCSSPCVVEGVCQSGRCVGTAESCDDGNACTTDSCDATRGCRHDSRVCDVPADPCQAAACDPVSGCTTVDVVDGTACGPTDCVTANVCLSGQCRAVPAVDGLECAPATPCQAAGRCAAGTCATPQATPPAPTWSYAPAPGRSLWRAQPPAVDAQGNLYVAEYSEDGTDSAQLVSFTSTGFERFRTHLPRGAWWLAVHPDVPQVLAFGHQLQAYDTTGKRQWSISLPEVVTGESPGAYSAVALSQPARWAVMVNTGVSAHKGTVVVLDAPTGAVSWKRTWDGDVSPLASGDGQQIVVGGSPCWGQMRATETVDSGSGTTVATGPAGRHRAWTRDLVVLSSSDAIRYLDSSGQELARSSVAPQDLLLARISPRHIWQLSIRPYMAALEVQARTGWLRTSVQLPADDASSLVLTNRASALLLLHQGNSDFLHEVREDGTTAYTCPLAGPEIDWISVGDEQIVGFSGTTLRAWKAPGLRPASEGFTEHGGGPSRSGRAR